MSQSSPDKQRRGNSETLLLSFAILNCIPRLPHAISAQAIKQKLEGDGIFRTERTIQRALKELCDIDFLKIECNKTSKPFSYSRARTKADLGWQLAPQESLLMLLAKQYLSQLLPANVQKNLASLLRSAEYVVQYDDEISDKKIKRLTKEWPEKVMFIRETQPLLPPPLNSEIFEKVSVALYHNWELELRYGNAAGELKEMTVQPLGLAQQGERVYLVCHIPKYNEQRTLAVHRIRAAHVTQFEFKRPANFDLKSYDSEGRFGYRAGKLIELIIDVRKDAGHYLLESRLHPQQKIDDKGDFYRITATVNDNSRLDSWLNSFGEALLSTTKRRIP